MKISKSLLCLSLGLTLSACGHYSEDLAAMDKEFQTKSSAPSTFASYGALGLNDVTPAAGAMSTMSYDEALAREYYALARLEQESMDYKSAKMFTEKAQRAMKGLTPAPAPANSDNAREKRAALVSAIETQNIPENYMYLAKAQAQYDHWIEQSGEGHQNDDIKNCRDGFEQAMAALVNPFAQKRAYAVAFDAGQSVLSPSAASVLTDMSLFIQNPAIKTFQIKLSGADAQKQAVASKLMDMGFEAGQISHHDAATASDTVLIDVNYSVHNDKEAASEI